MTEHRRFGFCAYNTITEHSLFTRFIVTAC